MHPLAFASRIAARASRLVVVAAALAMMAALTLQVVSRYGFGRAFSWTEELALFLFTWIVLLEASAAVRAGAHVRLVILLDRAPGRLRAVWERALDAVVLGFGLVFLWSGAAYVDATVGQVSAAVRYPIAWLYLAAPVAGALVALHALARLVHGPPAPDEAP